jgi:hypothetical protein
VDLIREGADVVAVEKFRHFFKFDLVGLNTATYVLTVAADARGADAC